MRKRNLGDKYSNRLSPYHSKFFIAPPLYSILNFSGVAKNFRGEDFKNLCMEKFRGVGGIFFPLRWLRWGDLYPNPTPQLRAWCKDSNVIPSNYSGFIQKSPVIQADAYTQHIASYYTKLSSFIFPHILLIIITHHCKYYVSNHSLIAVDLSKRVIFFDVSCECELMLQYHDLIYLNERSQQ